MPQFPVLMGTCHSVLELRLQRNELELNLKELHVAPYCKQCQEVSVSRARCSDHSWSSGLWVTSTRKWEEAMLPCWWGREHQLLNQIAIECLRVCDTAPQRRGEKISFKQWERKMTFLPSSGLFRDAKWNLKIRKNKIKLRVVRTPDIHFRGEFGLSKNDMKTRR